MSAVPEAGGGTTFRDDISESSGDVELSDPDSGSEVSSIPDEEVRAEDHVAEDDFRDAQENYSVGDPHAEYHAAEEAYQASQRAARPRAGVSDVAPSDFASAAEVLDETELEPAATNDDAATAAATAGNGNGDTHHAEQSDIAGDHEQTPAVPALTAETQAGAALPNIEAVEDSQPQAPTAQTSQAPKASTAAASEHDEDDSADATDVPPAAQPAEQKAAPEEEEYDSSRLARLPSLPAPRGSSSQQETKGKAAESASSSEVQKLVQQAISNASDSSAAHARPSDEIPSSSSNKDQPQHKAAASAAAPIAEDAPVSVAADDQPEQAAHKASEAQPFEQTPVASSTVQEQSAPLASSPPPPVAAGTAGAEPKPAGGPPPQGRGVAGPRLPSLPARKGGPSLPARPNAGSSAAPAASRQQETAVVPSAAASTPPATTQPVANNGHSQAHGTPAAATAGNGSATSTASIANGGTTANATTAPPQPSLAAANPGNPNSNPSSNPGHANPSIPPRQVAGNGNGNGNGQIERVAPGAAAAGGGEDEQDEHQEMREKVQNFRVLLVRLTLRLQQSTRGSIVQQVNYRLDLAERIRLAGSQGARLTGGRYGFEAACRTAQQLEQSQPHQPLPFSVTVMVIGMSGVGKSATINSILRNEAAATNAYKLGTHGIREVKGDVCGVKVRFIDTPGLQPGAALSGRNARLLNQMHAAHKKYKPDIMLYMDRADVFRTDYADVPLLSAITEAFGPSTWFNTIVALTHAAAAPPDGNGGPITYDTYTRTRTQLLQQNIRQASGDQRLLNPVALVENHPNCRVNQQGQAVLPNQLAWKEHLTLLLLSSKLLADTDSLLKIQQDSSAQEAQRRAMRMLLGGRKSPPMPYLINNFNLKKSPRKPPDEERQFRHDAELKDLSTMDRKEEMRKRREYSRMRTDEAKAEAGATQAGVPAPDIPPQPTFDAETTAHRYRYMEPGPDAAMCRPVQSQNGLDHDDGMETFSVEKQSVIRKRGVYVGGAPAYIMAQVHKDKDAFNIISEAEASYYHTHKLISTATLESQTVQTDALFTGKLETRLKMHPKNKTAAGILVSRLKEDGGLPTKGPIVYGAKLQDRVKVSDKVKVVVSTATLMNKPEQHQRKDQCWQHTAEVRLKGGEDDKFHVSIGGNNMRYHGKSGYGGSASVQYAHSVNTSVASSVQLTNERAGKVTVRVQSHEHPKMGLSLLIPVVGMIWGKIRGQD